VVPCCTRISEGFFWGNTGFFGSSRRLVLVQALGVIVSTRKPTNLLHKLGEDNGRVPDCCAQVHGIGVLF